MRNSTEARSWFWALYFGLSILCVGFFLGYLFSAPLLFLGGRGKQGRRRRVVARQGARNLCRSIGVLMSLQPWLSAEIELEALDAVKGSGCLLVSNHRSHLDAFLLLARVPGIRILAKKSLFRIPFLGLMMRLTRQIPAERGSAVSLAHAMDEVRESLRQGDHVHIFPEMTRCPPGFRGIRNFALAPFWAALQEGKPVIPIVIQGTDDVWPKGSARLGYRRPVAMRALSSVAPGEYSTAEALRDEVRRRIESAFVGATS